MNEKEKILTRIREALSVKAPRPGTPHADSSVSPVALPAQNPRRWLPKVSDGFAEQLALFQKNAADLKAGVQFLKSRDELENRLRASRDSENWEKIATHSGELTDLASRVLGLPICLTDKTYDVKELESCDAGITECDALVAQTGSVLLTARSAGGRALSVLPPHHVVLASREQLVGDLPTAFSLLKTKYSSGYPTFMTLITGPSRTGDIERILVLGAHGPRKLTIFFLDK
jgi:L-lactate dehydrogenase complex protein LldG